MPFKPDTSLSGGPKQALVPGGTVAGIKILNPSDRRKELNLEEGVKFTYDELGRTVQQNIVQQLGEGPNIARQVAEVGALFDKIPEGQQGPFYGRLAGLPIIKDFNTEFSQANADIKRSAQRYGRFMEGGVLRKEDEEKYYNIFPQIHETKAVRDYKMKSLVRDLSQEYNSRLQALQDSGVNIRNLKPLPIPPKPSLGKAREGLQSEIDAQFQAIKKSPETQSNSAPQDITKMSDDEIKKALGL